MPYNPEIRMLGTVGAHLRVRPYDNGKCVEMLGEHIDWANT
jgi:hypothetical protein